MEFLTSECFRGRRSSAAHRLACCEEFGACDSRPWSRTDTLEDRERDPEFVACANALAQAAKASAEGKVGESELEHVGRLFVETECLCKVALELIVRREGALGRLTLNRPEALGALTLGMCEAMTRALLAWRDDDGVRAVLIDHEGVGFMLADNAIELQQAELMVDWCAGVLDRGEKGTTESSMTKVAVSELLYRVADRCVQVMGGTGVSRDTVVQQVFREIRAFRIYDGPTEVHKWSIAKRIKSRATPRFPVQE